MKVIQGTQPAAQELETPQSVLRRSRRHELGLELGNHIEVSSVLEDAEH
jgi:hypothetical protein